jgi:pyruvate kinase
MRRPEQGSVEVQQPLRQREGRHPASAHNLAHYLALRWRDLRPLQVRLARQGLSSLGRVEAHIVASIDQVIHVLAGLDGAAAPPLDPSRASMPQTIC